MDETNEYCEVFIHINRQTSHGTIELVS
jgi:hypothetical protein